MKKSLIQRIAILLKRSEKPPEWFGKHESNHFTDRIEQYRLLLSHAEREIRQLESRQRNSDSINKHNSRYVLRWLYVCEHPEVLCATDDPHDSTLLSGEDAAKAVDKAMDAAEKKSLEEFMARWNYAT